MSMVEKVVIEKIGIEEYETSVYHWGEIFGIKQKGLRGKNLIYLSREEAEKVYEELGRYLKK